MRLISRDLCDVIFNVHVSCLRTLEPYSFPINNTLFKTDYTFERNNQSIHIQAKYQTDSSRSYRHETWHKYSFQYIDTH